ncbi:acyl-coenzyme A diphosphatase FITM2 [Synchiropus splendidus]|uniref:acyl-coenzyme A diphosphatase FITM2 n=1 Tax=Synchiropus splendidus TaxID=270530 RepID=UPI00237DF6A8|nr:acyl-coenzyme A diphosphatase FITM2 [Synchiropus splendidus]
MATADVIVDKLASFWGLRSARRNLPWIFMITSVVGSILKELQLVPHTYFSSSKNVLNIYFVKLSWGWTLALLSPFVLLTNSCVSGRSTFLGRRLLSLAVATAVWYVCTQTFFYIEDATGSCFQSVTLDTVVEELTSKSACRRAGFHWHGYDISGHSFILTYSSLCIVEEMAAVVWMKTPGLSWSLRTVVNLLYVALNLLVLIWVVMFTSTSLYFHDLSHKLLGTTCGLLAWFLTYHVWYHLPFSPGLPPQEPSRNHKLHS